MVGALIIDDEKHCSDNLQYQLKQYCPEIEVTAVCNSAERGLLQIQEQQPQLVFRAVIKVKDNGTGIPEAIRAKMMQPFFTTKSTGD